MNSTYFGLLAEFGEANIPLERVAPRYFGLSFEEARRRAPTKMSFEGTSRSCPPYVPSANDKRPGMPNNPAETPESETPIKIGSSEPFSREKLDRRVSVAPMMDWTDTD